MTSDTEIWKNFKNGDDKALEKIYFNHINILYSYGKSFTSDKELIKDTIQDLFCNLIRTRTNLGDTDNIRFYLLKAFKCLIIKKIKSEKRIVTEDSCDMLINSVPDSVNDNNMGFKLKRLDASLKKMTPKQREILYYRYSLNFDYDEICSIMKLKYDSARKLVFRAIQALKSDMTGKE